MRKLLCLLGFHKWYSDPKKWVDSFMKCEPAMQQCRYCDAERLAPVSKVIQVK
jgi:hypothetical protein